MLPAALMNLCAALVLMLSVSAKPATCADQCDAHTKDCTTLCQKKAGPKGQQPCKQACDDQGKMCEKACSGNSGGKK
jgi:hypothetical protein